MALSNIDPLALIRAASVGIRMVPASSYLPIPTEADPDPQPVPIPAQKRIVLDPGTLPDRLEIADGQPVDLAALVAVIWGALQQKDAARTRVAVGRTTLASGVYLAGATIDLPITFDIPPLSVPESGWVQLQPAIAWLGRTKAVVKEGSITATGCVVTVTALAAITPTAVNPITYEAVCVYTYSAVTNLPEEP